MSVNGVNKTYSAGGQILDKSDKICTTVRCATGISRLREKVKILTGKIVQKTHSVTHKETRIERAERFKKIPDKIETELTLRVGNRNVIFKSTCTPNITVEGGKKIWFSSDRGSAGHISNLWRHDIEVDREKISFIRSASTRGNEQATRELIAEALALQYDVNQLMDGAEVTLNLSNVQLMTPVEKVGDGDIPLKQMKELIRLAKNPQLAITHNGKTFKVKLNPPLLFNFGVNLQHFRMGKLAHSSEIDAINQESFRRLFGCDPENIGSGRFCTENSIIGTFMADKSVNETKKKRVQALAEQIISISKNHPDGIESNPYALPNRVMLLTNLLGFATTYGCKSGKDRTGLGAMELEASTAEILSTNELGDPENSSNEGKDLLQKFYLKGEATKIGSANTGQKGLKIQEFFGFKSPQQRFGVKLTKDPLVNALTELDKRTVADLRDLSHNDQEIKTLGEIRLQVAILLEKTKKKTKELTEEDKKAAFSASLELARIARMEGLSERYSDLINSIIDSSQGFFPESNESAQPKEAISQPEARDAFMKELKQRLDERGKID